MVIVARHQKELDEVAKEIHDRYDTDVEVVAADLSKQTSAAKVYEAATKKGPIEVLINNAGFGDMHYFKDADTDKLRNMINLNVLTLTNLSRLAVADMTQRGSGKILNVASTAAYMPGPMMAVYHATKSYVMSLSVAIAEELKGSGVTVTVLAPGVTRTEFQKTADMEDCQIVKNRDRMMTAYEVAHFGYEAMMDGKTIAVPGPQNKIVTALADIVPRSVSAKALHSIYKRGTKTQEQEESV